MSNERVRIALSSTHFSDETMKIWVHFDITLWKSIASRARVKGLIAWGDLDIL